MYILSSDRRANPGNKISGKRVETKMFDNLKEKSNKNVDDMLRKTGVTDDIKIDACSIVSDPRIADLMTEHVEED
jgi:peroxiredoxin family protein